MNTYCLFPALHLAEINWVQVRLFGELFLAHVRRLAIFPDGITDDLLMW
jgi:hypothetical protein